MEICLSEDEQGWFSEQFQAYFIAENVVVTFSTWGRSCACAECGRGPVLAAGEETEVITPGQGRHIWHDLLHATIWRHYGSPGLETSASFIFGTAVCNFELYLCVTLKDSVCQAKHSRCVPAQKGTWHHQPGLLQNSGKLHRTMQTAKEYHRCLGPGWRYFAWSPSRN